MSSFLYNTGHLEIINNTIDPETANTQVMLVQAGYASIADRTHLFLDEGGANDPVDHEISVVGYSRQAVTFTLGVNNTDHRVDGAFANIVFAALAAGQTIEGAVWFLNTGNDLTARMLGFMDLPTTPTNGGDINLNFNALGAGGNYRVAHLLT